jgi:hypothetical protein
MTYKLIDPPFLDFRERSKKELDAYRYWFVESILQRIAELTRAVKTSPGFETWEPDSSVSSFEQLGQWFERQVETRARTSTEMDRSRATLRFPVDVPSENLTDRTTSLAFDAGMYFALVVLNNLPGTRWDMPLKNERFADYGQPVIIGFGAVPLNPARTILMTACGVARKQPAHFAELYETWANMRQ